jgi:hypothetical protein
MGITSEVPAEVRVPQLLIRERTVICVAEIEKMLCRRGDA